MTFTSTLTLTLTAGCTVKSAGLCHGGAPGHGQYKHDMPRLEAVRPAVDQRLGYVYNIL